MREIRFKVEVSWTLERIHSHAGKPESQTEMTSSASDSIALGFNHNQNTPIQTYKTRTRFSMWRIKKK